MWLLERPYITLFLLSFLWLAHRRWGWQRTLCWLVSGYLIALASEACSIRTGFPYGLYFYNYANLVGDPLVFGVPFWDTLSYPFMIYAGYAVATRIVPGYRPMVLAILGAFFTMLLDVIIDPISHLGAQWFLGEIYNYANPGFYFDVPLSNFAGWWLVAFLVIIANQQLWKYTRWTALPVFDPGPSIFDLAFYFSIALFGVVISAMIGAWWLALSSMLILAGTFSIIFRDLCNKLRPGECHPDPRIKPRSRLRAGSPGHKI